MQLEDTESRCFMWNALNYAMASHNVLNPNFKEFMIDSAQENWNVVCLIYESGDVKIPMEDHERTCLLHWIVSLNRHTQRLIRSDMQNQHEKCCANNTKMLKLLKNLNQIFNYPSMLAIIGCCNARRTSRVG